MSDRWPRRPGLLLLVLCLLAAVLASSCGGPPGEREAAGRPELLPLAEPDLSEAEEAVREQVRGSEAKVRGLVADPAADAGRLAESFGDLGILYVTYSFLEAAEVAFRNARTLRPDDYRWAYLLGYLFEVQGRLSEASEALESALELAPAHKQSLLRLGNVRLELGRAAAAESVLRRVLEQDPDSAAAWNGLGRAAAALQDHAAAVDHFERALELQPAASSVHHALGLSYRNLGDLERARYHLERGGDAPVLFEDPLFAPVTELGRSAELYLVRAAQAFSEGRFEIAATNYRQALELDPSDFTARKALGFCLEKLGDIDGALHQLAEGLRLGATGDEERDRLERAEIYRIKGGLLVLHGREGEAIEAFNTSLELNPDQGDARFKLANALARAGRLEEAMGHYDRVLADRPEAVEVLVRRGTALVNLRRGEAALADFRRAVELEPEDPELRRRYAEALEFLGRGAEAGRQRRQAASLLAEDAPERRAEVEAAEGDRLQARGEFERALERYRAALALDPANLDARYELAATLGHLGRFAEALPEFEQVVSEAPRHAPARRGMAAALVLQERFPEARARLHEALEALPRDRQLAHLLARLLASAPDDRVRDGRLAVELAQRIFAVKQDLTAAETLAMAYAEAGQIDRAVTLQEDLVARAEGAGDEEGARQLRLRLDAYRRDEPWRARSADEILGAALSSG